VNVHAYLGVPPRANFWTDKKNVEEFQERFNAIKDISEYLKLREWYIKNAPEESSGNEKKDHIPFILEQLSKPYSELPSLRIKKDTSLLDAIQMPAMEYAQVEGYNPNKWDAKAMMAT